MKTIIILAAAGAAVLYFAHLKQKSGMVQSGSQVKTGTVTGWGNSSTNFPTMVSNANAAQYQLLAAQDAAINAQGAFIQPSAQN